jgi:hypothetical protein
MIEKDSIRLDLINNSLRDNGYVIIKNFLTENIQNKIKDFVISKISELDKDRFSLNETELVNTTISEFINSTDFINFCENFEEKNKIKNLQFNYHYLVNFTKKKKKTDEKFSFHYDAFINTIIIPINIHNEKNTNFSMSLEIIPNFRKLTNSMVLNIFQKFLIQNRLFKFFSNTRFFKFFFKSINVKLNFGEILIFNGFRTLHSHSISPANAEREKARLIIHVYNPFINNKLDRIIFKNIQKKRIIDK